MRPRVAFAADPARVNGIIPEAVGGVARFLGVEPFAADLVTLPRRWARLTVSCGRALCS